MVWMGIGRTVLDRYVLVRPIGQGGVSHIFQAVDTASPRLAAVKMLSPEFLGCPHTVSAARREATIMRRLRHPSVPVVYHDGEMPLGGGGRTRTASVPCVAMELLTGAPLAGRLEAGPLPWRRAVHCAATIADLLAVAHRRGVVHRDLTASNIMVTRSGLKVIDFGLATGGHEGACLSGHPADVSGHPADPSGHRSDLSGDPAGDVHALGLLLYQMLTGRSPYPNADPAASLALARFGFPAPAPVLLVAGLPRAVADLCRRCLSKRAADRPDSVTAALELWSVLMAAEHHDGPAQQPAQQDGQHLASRTSRTSRIDTARIAAIDYTQ